MEFMQSVGFLLLIFVVLTPIIYSAYQNNRNSQLGSEAQVVADQLSSEINTAVAVGRGYRRIFTLPKSLGDSSDYAMAIYPSEQLVVVNWTEVNSASAAIVTGNVTAKALDAPRKGDNAIFNNGGIIEIS
ncbi:hypothetical protein HY095_06120 [Candidatus Micrarchaeota archaeon]|nr:hypothetical protein [Candidatus Micrarchaeota archaeon]